MAASGTSTMTADSGVIETVERIRAADPDNMLERISDFLDEEIETTLSGLTALIEPILIVVLGVIIGGMVICMFLPIFKMSEIVNMH